MIAKNMLNKDMRRIRRIERAEIRAKRIGKALGEIADLAGNDELVVWALNDATKFVAKALVLMKERT